MDTRLYCVYYLREVGAERPFYVGKTLVGREAARLREHLCDARKSTTPKAYKIQKVIRLGGKIRLQKLVVVGTPDSADEIEKALISLHGRRNNKTGTLCNLTDGGEGNVGTIMSTETRLKMSVAKRGNKLNLGRKRPDTVRKFSKPLSLFDHCGRFIATFPSARWAAKITGIGYKMISSSLTRRGGIVKTPQGTVVQFHFGTSTRDVPAIVYKPRSRIRPATIDVPQRAIQGI